MAPNANFSYVQFLMVGRHTGTMSAFGLKFHVDDMALGSKVKVKFTENPPRPPHIYEGSLYLVE